MTTTWRPHTEHGVLSSTDLVQPPTAAVVAEYGACMGLDGRDSTTRTRRRDAGSRRRPSRVTAGHGVPPAFGDDPADRAGRGVWVPARRRRPSRGRPTGRRQRSLVLSILSNGLRRRHLP